MADMAIRMETSNQLNKNGNWHIMVKDISPETAAELAAQEDVYKRQLHKLPSRNYDFDQLWMKLFLNPVMSIC